MTKITWHPIDRTHRLYSFILPKWKPTIMRNKIICKQTLNGRKTRRGYDGVSDSEDNKEAEAHKIAVFSVNCELKLDALTRVFEGTHSKFVEDSMPSYGVHRWNCL
eukprot:122233_1